MSETKILNVMGRSDDGKYFHTYSHGFHRLHRKNPEGSKYGPSTEIASIGVHPEWRDDLERAAQADAARGDED